MDCERKEELDGITSQALREAMNKARAQAQAAQRSNNGGTRQTRSVGFLRPLC